MTGTKAHHAALPPGYRLHWYEIESILGQGGFGITYLANDLNLEQKVAIKEFLPTELAVRTEDSSVEPMSDGHTDTFSWGLSRFITEAKTLAKFTHANIVSVLSVFEANNTAYMVMAYVDGQTLETALNTRRIETEAQLLSMTQQLLDGLGEIHAAGFIHRDIKPANIFIKADETPVLLDFGSARQALGGQTKTLTALVSPGYAPFEQYGASKDKDNQGPWTDIYALGATLYRAVAGRGPIDAIARANALMSGKADLLIPAVELGRDNFTPHFLASIDWALQFLPENRPQTVEQWRPALEGKLTPPVPDEVATVVAPVPLAERPETVASDDDGKPTVGKHRWAIALAAVVALGAFGWYWLHSVSPTQVVESVEDVKQTQSADELARLQREVQDKEATLAALEAEAESRRQQEALQAEIDRLNEETRLAEETARITKEKQLAEETNRIAQEQRIAEETERIAKEKQLAEEANRIAREQRIAEEAERTAQAATVAAEAGPTSTEQSGEVLADTRDSSASQSETNQSVMDSLLRQADADLASLRLTSPANNNAFEKYQRVLSLQPGNARATQGLHNIVAAYVRLSNQAIAKDDLSKAQRYLNSATKVSPDAPLLVRSKLELEQAKIARSAAKPSDNTVANTNTDKKQTGQTNTASKKATGDVSIVRLLGKQQTPLQIGNNKIDYGLDRGVSQVANRKYVGASHSFQFQLQEVPSNGGVVEIETVDVTSESSCYQYVRLNERSVRFKDDGRNGVNRFKFDATDFRQGVNRLSVISKECQDEVVVVNDFVLLRAQVKLN